MLVFLIAGYETTALTISNCCYTLATKPDELQKLQDEIDSNIDQNVYRNIHFLILYKNFKISKILI